MPEHEKINYVEFPAKDIEATKKFFQAAFNWSFVDYGPEYTSFSNEGLDGGFFRSDKRASTENGSALIVFYSRDLEATEEKIAGAGGTIVRPIFSFPGGRRFHFADPGGNEYAVWSDIGARQGAVRKNTPSRFSGVGSRREAVGGQEKCAP